MDRLRNFPVLGWRVFGLGVIALAAVGFLLGDFIPGQPAPHWLPMRVPLAYTAATFMLAAGAAIEWRRTLAWAAAALAAYYGVIVVLLMDGRMIVRNADQYLAYSNTAEQLAIFAGALILAAQHLPMEAGLAERLAWAGRKVFGFCAVLFGGAHFFYMNFTAPLVPKWLPPSQLFWGQATGVFHIAGGLAILLGVRDRLAAILLTVMYGLFTPLVHLPILAGDPSNHTSWIENATNLVLTGVAWVVADSLRPRAEPA